uniref:Uncharacterized protein n=1 Tax=Strombidium rassoulzadegani TaxID=1082188 RepID=A0A7S3CJU5_9SPIT|mmetsp:Transcript_13206/g.22402  ORF Transcript_13206/g.22402 Transcript_13206/m.22402 type:complete len:261 (+) Transcript_13206:1300-2082(+)
MYDNEIRKYIEAENALNLMRERAFGMKHYPSREQSDGRRTETLEENQAALLDQMDNSYRVSHNRPVSSSRNTMETNLRRDASHSQAYSGHYTHAQAAQMSTSSSQESSRFKEIEKLCLMQKQKAMLIAERIFDQYLKKGARFEILIPDHVLYGILVKFGCKQCDFDEDASFTSSQYSVRHLFGEHNSGSMRFYQDFNEEILFQNLNQGLFIEVYNYILDQLNDCYQNFRKSLGFLILKEDIKRRELLYEIMIESKFLQIQ